jgi:hypothetical protein
MTVDFPAAFPKTYQRLRNGLDAQFAESAKREQAIRTHLKGLVHAL